MTMRRSVLVLFVMSLCGAACDAPSAASRDLTIRRQDGRTVVIEAELAVTPQQREQGLMGRQNLAPLHGMLFTFDAERPLTFWMKNTPLFLDLLFADKTGTIVHIHHKARPYDETLIRTPVPAQYVLEIKGGEADANGLKTGDRFQL